MYTTPVFWLLLAGSITLVLLSVLLYRQWQYGRQLSAQLIQSGLTPDGVNYSAGTGSSMLAQFNNKVLFKRVYDHAPVGKLIATPDSRIIMVNPMLAHILRCEESDLLGLPLTDLTYSEDVPLTLRELDRIRDGQLPSYQMEKRYVRHDGTLVWVLVNATILRDHLGQPECIVAQILDIDERRRIMQQLRLRENIVNNTGAGVALTYNGRQLDLINPAFAGMHGYQPEELQHSDLNQLLNTQYKRRLESMLQQAAEHSPVSGELSAVRNDGSSFPVLVNISAVRDEDDVLLYWIINYQDLTAQKATEESLRISKNRLKEAERLAGVGGWEWNTAQDFIWWSDGMYCMLDVEKGNVDKSTENYLTLVCEEDRYRFSNAVLRSIKYGHDFNVEYGIVTPLGNKKYIRSTATIQLIAPDKFIMVGANLDITSIRCAENALQQSQQRLQTLTENLPGLVFQAKENFSGSDVEFTYISRSPEEFFCSTDASSSGINGLMKFIPELERQRFCSALNKARETESLWDWDGKMQFTDGVEAWVQIRAMPRREGDRLVWEGMVFDVSKAKKAEREIFLSRNLLREMASEMEVIREQERKQIARDIHDELGQILTALRMDVSVMRFKYPDAGEEHSRILNNMTEVVDRAIGAVRSVAKNLRPAALDMGFPDALEWLIKDLSGHSGLQCKLNGDYENIDIDEARATVIFRLLQESFTNIVRHANASRVDILLAENNYELNIIIRDDGVGFYPRKDYQSRKSFGLLGMKERCLALGGDIQIHSAPGRGTEIQINIPVNTNSMADQYDLCLDCG